jgi:A118 family predicted phage portal protein
MNSKIIEFLRKKKYNPYSSFYPTIDLWISLWKGKTEFHRYKVNYGDKTYEMEMYSLGMPQRIANDWSNIGWSEKDTIVTSAKNQKYLNEKLEEVKFNNLLQGAIEKSAYSGTCGAIWRVKNAKLVNGELTTDKFTKYDLITMRADQIIPLRVEHGKIIDCAFISETRIQDKKVYYIEIHELVKRADKETKEEYMSYKISNLYIDENGKEVPNEKVLREFYTKSEIPLFSILTPPIDNPYPEANGLGFAIYGNAIDQLYAVDIAYNNFVMDYYLGGKKIFYNKRLCRQDEKGNVIYPTDIQKQQWQIVGDEMENANEQSLIHEYNPDLRVGDNTTGLQFHLDLLSFKSLLGNKYYEFNNSGNVVTATQYLGERQDLTINAKKYRANIDEFIINICRGVLLLGRILFKQNVNENDKIEVENTDGFLISTEDLKETYMQEISAGLRSKISYMMKFMGMNEEEAKKELARINEEDSISSIDLDEGE